LTAKGARRFDSKLAASNYAIEHVRGGCTIVRVKRKARTPHPLAGYWAVMDQVGQILRVHACESSANNSANLWPAARLAVVQLDERGMVPR